jgi:hypothetical protein
MIKMGELVYLDDYRKFSAARRARACRELERSCGGVAEARAYYSDLLNGFRGSDSHHRLLKEESPAT